MTPKYSLIVAPALNGLNDYHDENSSTPYLTLGPISRINVFVGATNSGKSRFLRGLLAGELYNLVTEANIEHLATILEICNRYAVNDLTPLPTIKFLPNRYQGAGGSGLQSIMQFAKDNDLSGDNRFVSGFFTDLRRDFLGTFNIIASDFNSGRLVLSDSAFLSDSVKEKRAWLDLVAKIFEQHLFAGQLSEYIQVTPNHSLDATALSDFRSLSNSLGAWLNDDHLRQERPHRVYIPVLRSAVRLFSNSNGKITEDILGETASQNYELAPNERLEIFSGSQLYEIVLRERNGSLSYRTRLEEFQSFLSINFFEGRTIQLIPLAEEDDKERRLVLNIGGMVDRKFHNVGDGIQALIILMYRLFTAQPNSWIFIEEPELNLHPGLQRIFLHSLAHNDVLRAKNLRIFFTTHSNHLVGMLIPELEDVSVFSFQESPEPNRFLIRLVLDRRHDPLTLLGVSNSSVFLANCSVWVEGVTDRAYLRAYLKAFQESDDFRREGKRVMLEDIHYAFLEYAGSNLSHYLFGEGDDEDGEVVEGIQALAVCNRIFLLADRDEGKEEKHARLLQVEERLEDSFVYAVTDGIEIENLISGVLLEEVLSQVFPRIDASSIVIDESKYESIRLGTYLQSVFGTKAPVTLMKDSGTLSTRYKNKLAQHVAEKASWATMSDASRELAQKLYAFIERHNSIYPQPS